MRLASPLRPRFAALLPLLAACTLASATLRAQRTEPPNGPVQPESGTRHALVGADVVVAPGRELVGATVLIHDEKIAGVFPAGQAVPDGVTTHDVSGLTVYAAFVDPYVRVPLAETDDADRSLHWNPNVRPERHALEAGPAVDDLADELRTLGFGTAAVAPAHGIFRGRGEVVTLEDTAAEPRVPMRSDAFDAVGFEPLGDDRGGGRDLYPRSRMGAVALIRQTLIDAAAEAPPAPGSSYVTALQNDLPLAFDARDELEALRAAAIAEEFGRDAMLIGSGFEFRRLDAIAACGLPLVVPLAFPQAPAIETIDERSRVTLRELLSWEHAPTGPRRLLDRGVRIALTTDRLGDRSRFHARLARAVRYGLDHDAALAALTTTPAAMLRVEDRLGRVEAGMLANVVVVDGRLGDDEAEVRSVWIRGREHVVEHEDEAARLEGRWDVALRGGGIEIDSMTIGADGEVELAFGDTSATARSARTHERQLDFVFDTTPFLDGEGASLTLHAFVRAGRMIGSGEDAEGRRFAWSARRAPALAEASATSAPSAEPDPRPAPFTPRLDVELPVPLGAYGRVGGLPPAESVVLAGAATVWTSGPEGILENASVWIRDGRIAWVGPADRLPAEARVGARSFDATGFHVTPGLIDCHSHTGIRGGVNEGTQAVTAEVRVSDALDPDDVNWYRQLASGVTCVQQLHGSANPIGGQSSVVKLRWGVTRPDAMRFEAAPPGIKFALGENVKQSNWGDRYRDRYPQTRMGVEALIRDRFFAARAYAEAATERPRDLELEALAQILAGERFVHCHSYRQDEILMLCRVAREFGFVIGTFQHGLECYKVADAVREASRGASVFTDWWAYKFEVVDAIPENAAILHEQGVTVSFNSDSNELARRLNTEAAKAVKYGGVDPATALRFVTLHPAIQLGVDGRTGSIEVGKDADLAVWNASPLSSYARCVRTYVDGRCYWSDEEDRTWRDSVRSERARIVQVLLGLDASEREGESRADRRSRRADGIDNLPGECGCCDRSTAAAAQAGGRTR